MAFNWQKLFENWTWHNRTQSKDTPINATNLNKINNAIDGIDNRVVAVGEALDELVFEDVTVSGNPAVFESRAEQLSKQTTVNIEPIQSGSGTPSPSNIRPIRGLDSVDVTVADAQTSPTTSQTYTTTLPTTVYGGTLDLTNGRLVVDRAILSVDNSWSYGTYGGKNYITMDVADAYNIDDGEHEPICNMAEFGGYRSAAFFVDGKFYMASYPSFYIQDSRYTSKSAFIAAYSDCKIAYYLATPVITTITPSSLSLLKGLNVVSTNGDTVEVTFNQGSLATLEDVLSIAELIPREAENIAQEKIDATVLNNEYSRIYNARSVVVEPDTTNKVCIDRGDCSGFWIHAISIVNDDDIECADFWLYYDDGGENWTYLAFPSNTRITFNLEIVTIEDNDYLQLTNTSRTRVLYDIKGIERK